MKWTAQPIGSLAERSTSGGTPATGETSYYGGDIPWLRTQEVNFNYIYDTEMKITDAGLENSAAKWIAENSVIVALYGNSAGRVAINKIALTTNQACGNFTIDPSKADYRFVYYALLKDYEVLHGMAKGAAQNNLNLAMVKDYNLRVPALAIQNRIASILSAYDDLIENNRRRMALLEKAARLLYEEWFVRFRFPDHEHTSVSNGLPKGWEKKRLDTVAELNRASLSGRHDGEIEYVDISAVNPGQITETVIQEFRDAPSRARRIVQHGDIIWSCVRPTRRSHAVIWNPPDNLIVSTGFAVITPTTVPTSFLYFATTTDAFVGYLGSHAKGAAYPAVVACDFERATLVVPTNRLLKAFDQIIEPMFSQINNLRLQNHKLRAARDLLLPRLMSGEIEV